MCVKIKEVEGRFGMKKLFLAFIFALFIMQTAPLFAETEFVKALRNCEKYSQLGGVEYEHTYYNILVTLEKNKKMCTYKEKIYRDTGYQLLTCNFDMGLMNGIADSMDRFTNAYKKEMAKNKIFEAKLTLCAEVFENYLINGKYCKITSSKTK